MKWLGHLFGKLYVGDFVEIVEKHSDTCTGNFKAGTIQAFISNYGHMWAIVLDADPRKEQEAIIHIDDLRLFKK